ncbi:sulfurtransferase [Natronoglycomyces albus]|uniref:Sulfurtransferase n=1 Tax=Natronoglycomyces albus TaxID=2811108 RepID=A0A895XXM3_9ACTN|nr:sulfurtransferase [Natronoglycomyces albus]QSB06378.1 sulfurtransferase [Natronoglycomyces albus]
MPLITATELAELLESSPPPCVLDIRWQLQKPTEGREAYNAGHIPGAVFLDLDEDVCGPPGEAGRHPLPDPEKLQESLRSAGINNDSIIVCYDDGHFLSAARTWWTLRWAGLKHVYVLDGGYKSWVDERREVTTEAPEVEPGTVEIETGHETVLNAEAAAVWADQGKLVDVRDRGRYFGEKEFIDPVAGHIPGAGNLPSSDDIDDKGRFLTKGRLRDRYRDHVDTALYCGSGVTAARSALAMTVAGYKVPPLYIGSWSNWIAEDRPVSSGD